MTQYTTRRGDKVILHAITPRNSSGSLVTFPIKGTIIDKDKPRVKRYQIWTIDGAASILRTDSDDIIDLKLNWA